MRSEKAGINFVLVTLLLDAMGIGLVLPILPGLIVKFLGNDTGATAFTLGFAIALHACMQFVFSPFLGELSDRFGRRPLLLSSLAGAGADYVLLAFAPNLTWLFVGRVIAGITGASMATAGAYVADVSPPEKRGQNYGLAGAAFGVGFVVGPAIGGLLGHFSLRLPFFVAAGLNIANFAYGALVLPESLKRENRRAFSLRRANPFGAMFLLGRNAVLRRMACMFVCAGLAQQVIQGVWPLYTRLRFGWSELELGLSLTLFGILIAISYGSLAPKVIRKLGERRTLILGHSIEAIGFTAFGLANRGWLVYALTVPYSVGGVAGPAMQTLFSETVGEDEQGAIQGALNSVKSLTTVVGPIIGTYLLARFGQGGSASPFLAMPFFLATLIHVAGIPFALSAFSEMRRADGRNRAI